MQEQKLVRPEWLTVRLAGDWMGGSVSQVIQQSNLQTVCLSAACPNIGHCYQAGTATFLILGKVCSRDCWFCAVQSGVPAAVDPTEPYRVAMAAQQLCLQHVVITSVTRDDLTDGGARQFAACIQAVRAANAHLTVEVLIPDFQGNLAAVMRVLQEKPDVFNHNIETVPRIYPAVRPGADYLRSLNVLKQAGQRGDLAVKSGLMVGLGETGKEVIEVLADLRAAGVSMLTIGQYLQPSKHHIAVAEYVHPDKFAEYEQIARQLGFKQVASGPLVRSSYHAAEFLTAYHHHTGGA
ncbi:lipoyl synthase [Sporomusaceae bacterium FL31]|nr:lipoyl synthase [Sporomusaceae bacterium FL31]GCE34627.1 lipoyl synthase [Sporomusaceae bacterium]